MSKKNLSLAILGIMSLSLLSCGGPHSPGISSGISNQLKNMKPRALIAMTAMHALLETSPEMEDRELARRAFEIADAMIIAAEQPGSTEQ